METFVEPQWESSSQPVNEWVDQMKVDNMVVMEGLVIKGFEMESLVMEGLKIFVIISQGFLLTIRMYFCLVN